MKQSIRLKVKKVDLGRGEVGEKQKEYSQGRLECMVWEKNLFSIKGEKISCIYSIIELKIMKPYNRHRKTEEADLKLESSHHWLNKERFVGRTRM